MQKKHTHANCCVGFAIHNQQHYMLTQQQPRQNVSTTRIICERRGAVNALPTRCASISRVCRARLHICMYILYMYIRIDTPIIIERPRGIKCAGVEFCSHCGVLCASAHETLLFCVHMLLYWLWLETAAAAGGRYPRNFSLAMCSRNMNAASASLGARSSNIMFHTRTAECTPVVCTLLYAHGTCKAHSRTTRQATQQQQYHTKHIASHR